LPISYRDVNQRYFSEMSRVSFRLLEVISIGLGLEPTALHGLFKPSHTSFLRLNYYPVTPGAAPDSLGISPHKDAGFLTVLVQDDVAGLQVRMFASL
jgi:isopenicillin N synthase-like dioxygenase